MTLITKGLIRFNYSPMVLKILRTDLREKFCKQVYVSQIIFLSLPYFSLYRFPYQLSPHFSRPHKDFCLYVACIKTISKCLQSPLVDEQANLYRMEKQVRPYYGTRNLQVCRRVQCLAFHINMSCHWNSKTSVLKAI